LEKWEAGFLLFTVDWAYSVLRVLKPGASGLVWSIPRTSDLTQFGLRLAGFEIRDVVSYLFGSGFPKSHNISKAMDKHFGAKREVVGIGKSGTPSSHQSSYQMSQQENNTFGGEYNIDAPTTSEAKQWDGWGSCLKPAHEDWILIQKPLDGTYVNNALTWGVAGLNIDGGRVGTEEKLVRPSIQRKPGEAIFPLGAGVQVEPAGRFPANLVLDDSNEILACFPESKTGAIKPHQQNSDSDSFGMKGKYIIGSHNASEGSAARFFYCAKSSRSEREAGLIGYIPCIKCGQLDSVTHINPKTGKVEKCIRNNHPTLKSITLMEYLVRLTKTPTGGVVIDPFLGTGTTLIACVLTGRKGKGFEKKSEYFEIAKRRIQYFIDKPKQLNLL